jgi:hypothetical protein
LTLKGEQMGRTSPQRMTTPRRGPGARFVRFVSPAAFCLGIVVVVAGGIIAAVALNAGASPSVALVPVTSGIVTGIIMFVAGAMTRTWSRRFEQPP